MFCLIYDKYPNKQLIAKVEMTKNIMFPLITRNGLTNSLNSYKTKSLDQSWIWHLRYGYLHFGGLDFLQKKQMVKGFLSIHKPTRSCESCILAKHHRENFISGVSYREKILLVLIHIDLSGLVQPPYLIGNVYFMTFVDDFS